MINKTRSLSLLKKAGLKVTSPRLSVLDVLASSKKGHLSAEDIYKELLESASDIGLATIYRVLSHFQQVKLVSSLNFSSGRTVYEMEKGEHHDHLVCLQCGIVEEFMDSEIEQRQLKVAKKYQFTLTDHSLTLYGTCKKCAEAHSRKNSKISNA